MKHILLIGGWTETYEAALNLGYKVTGFAAINQRALISETVLANCQFFDIDATDISLALLSAIELHNSNPIHGVFSFTEKGLETAAVIATTLRIPGNELDANVRTRNKNLTRDALTGTDLDNVPWKVAYNEGDVIEFFESNGPFVIKPINGVGSEGVNVIQDSQTLTFDLTTRGYPTLLERYIDGAEYSVETLSLGGFHTLLTVTQKTLTENLVEMQHLMPAPILQDERDALEKAVILLISTLGVQNAVAHSEFRVNRDSDGNPRVYLIETQLRPGGGRIWKLLEICRGIDVFSTLIRGTLDKTAKHPTLRAERPCLAYFPRFEQGIVNEIKGIDDVRSSIGVELVDLEISVGRPTRTYVSSATRNGSIIVSAASHSELIENRNTALSHLSVKIKKT